MPASATGAPGRYRWRVRWRRGWLVRWPRPARTPATADPHGTRPERGRRWGRTAWWSGPPAAAARARTVHRTRRRPPPPGPRPGNGHLGTEPAEPAGQRVPGRGP